MVRTTGSGTRLVWHKSYATQGKGSNGNFEEVSISIRLLCISSYAMENCRFFKKYILTHVSWTHGFNYSFQQKLICLSINSPANCSNI